MKSLLWSFAILLGSIAASMLALANYCHDNNYCTEDSTNKLNMTSVILFLLSSSILSIIIIFSIMDLNTLVRNKRKNVLFCI